MSLRQRLLSLVWFLTLVGALAAEPAEPPRDRHGDPLPAGAIARLGSMRWRGDQFIQAAAFSADGKTLATTSDGRSIIFWDPATGRQVRRVQVKAPAGTTMFRLGADAKTMMVTSYDGVIRFFDTNTGAEQRALSQSKRGYVRALELARDGKIAVSMHQGTIIVWDVPGNKALHEFALGNMPLPPGGLLALTPDSKHLVMPHKDGTLHLVDVASGKEVRAIEMPPATPGGLPTLRVQRLVISPDGKYLALSGASGRVSLCDLATGKRVREWANTAGANVILAFTPNSRFLAVGGFQHISLYGVLSGKEVRRLPKGTPRVTNALVFAPDGRTLVALHSGYSVELWDVADSRPLHTADGHTQQIQSLVFLADGKRLASAGFDQQLIVWDAVTGRDIARRRGVFFHYPISLGVTGDGKTLRYLASDRFIHLWEPSADRAEQRPAFALPNVNQVALSPDGQSVAALTPDRKLFLRDLKSNKPPLTLTLTQSPQVWINIVQFSPDSRLVLTSGSDGLLRLWDRASGKQVREVKVGGPVVRAPSQVMFSRDGRSLAMFDGQLHLVELATGANRITLPPMVGGVTTLALSPDGRWLAHGHFDGSIAVCGTGTGKDIAVLQGHQGQIMSLAFSRDSRLLASGGGNGTALVWKLPESEGLSATLTADQAASLWQALNDIDAARANRALAGLAAAPAQAIPLIKERFRAARKPPDAAQLAQLIADLDDDAFKVRERATRELIEAGTDAVEPLRKALANNPSTEAKRRMEDLLNRLQKGGGAPERLRSLRAIEALERIGTPQAKDLLKELAGKPLPAELDDEIHASLQRLGEGS